MATGVVNPLDPTRPAPLVKPPLMPTAPLAPAPVASAPLPVGTAVPIAPKPPILSMPTATAPTAGTALRTSIVQPPSTGGAIAPQNAQPTLQALQQALTGSVSPMAEQLRQMGMTSLQGLSSSPDRLSLANQAFQLMNEQSAPQFAQDMRAVGQNAAAFGRTGSGMTTNELTDLASQRYLQQQQAAKGLSLDAAGQTMADRFGIFDRTAGYGGQIGGQDLQRAGFGQGIANNQFDIGSAVRNQAVGNRDFAADQGWRRTALQESQQGRQDQQAQQAIENAKQQQLLQEQLLQGQFGRQFDTNQQAWMMGSSGSPWGMQYDASQGLAGQAGQSQAALQAAAQQAALQRYLGQA